MSLDEFVNENSNCDSGFETVYAEYFDGKYLEVKNWGLLMAAFERTELLRSTSAMWAMIFAPIEKCIESAYTYYFQCLVADENIWGIHEVGNLWDQEKGRGKVFGGLCRWASLHDVQQFVKSQNEETIRVFLDSGLYWSGDNECVFLWLVSNFKDCINEEIVKNVVRDTSHYMPDGRYYYPVGSWIATNPKKFLKWDHNKPRTLMEEIEKAYSRELKVLGYLLSIPKYKKVVREFHSPEPRVTFFRRAYDLCALPVVELLNAHGIKFMRGEEIPKPNEETASLLEELMYKYIPKGKAPRRARRGNTQAQASASLTPHAQLLQMHTKTLLEVSKSLAQLLK